MRIISIVFLVALVGTLAASTANAERRFATLKAGTVEFLQHSADADTGTASATKAAPAPAAHSQPRASALWGSAAGQRLFLMNFQSKPQRDALREFLASRGATIGSYVPQNTWVVSADQETANAADLLKGIIVEPYVPDYRVDPQWQPVLQAVEQMAAVHSRRSLSQVWAASAAAAGSETSGGGGGGSGSALDGLLLRDEEPGLEPQAVIEVSFPLALGQLRQQQQAAAQQQRRQMHSSGSRDRRQLLGSWSPADVAVTEWSGQLAELLHGSGPACRPGVTPSGSSSVQVSVCLQDLEAAVAWLSLQPLVSFLAPAHHQTMHNLYASTITQNGGLPEAARTRPLDPGSHPMWQAGLDGTGQIVGVGDTGLSMDSCFFFDPAYPVTASNATRVGSVYELKMPNHRKVVHYYGYMNLVDEEGHGTHVSGTVAGVPLRSAATSSDPGSDSSSAPGSDLGSDPSPGDGASDPRYAQGVAPGAKIAFFDIYRTNRRTALTFPPDLERGYFKVQYDVGVRVQSNSWGDSQAGTYDSSSAATDLFAWHNPDFLAVFAAGNEAANSTNTKPPFDRFGLKAEGTVWPPGDAKNALTVGASMNYMPPSATDQLLTVFSATNSATGQAINPNITIVPSVSTDFGSHAPLLGKSFQIGVAAPYLGCSPLQNAEELRGKVVMIGRGVCFFKEKVAFAMEAGAIAVLIVNNDSSPLTAGGNDDGLTTPVSSLTLPEARAILALWNATIPNPRTITMSTVLAIPAASTVLLKVQYTVPQDLLPVQDNVASFSSYGPTPDGRIKPDIMAPGATLLSAGLTGAWRGRSDSCGTQRLMGTSMATPVVSGSAALVRQYFMEGYYPSGAARTEDRYLTPSGILVKAVLLAGATPMTGRANLVRMLLDPAIATRFSGHGRLDLSRSLPLISNSSGSSSNSSGSSNSSSTGTTPRWSMQVVDKAEIEEGDTHSYSLTSSGGPLVATLVWYDYPSDPSGRAGLVNDLDLQVGIEGKIYRGNGGVNGTKADRRNTVERVLLDDVEAGATVNIRVKANNINSRFLDRNPQLYALVLLGMVQGTLDSSYNPAHQP